MRLSLRVVAAVEQATVRDVGKSGNSKLGGKKIQYQFRDRS